MKRIVLVAAILVAAGARNSTKFADNMDARVESAKPTADNTENRQWDREHSALRPGDQAENEADRVITQQVRQQVADALPVNARNVKIITANGVVTLRGPVGNREKKAEIAGIALSILGVTRVDNQLEIAANAPR